MQVALLRPFAPKTAKYGDKVYWSNLPARWLGVSDQDEKNLNIIEHACGLAYAPDKDLCQAPLSWVEYRPVYPGDTLYWNGFQIVVASFDGEYLISGDMGLNVKPEALTWAKPKVSKAGWINIYSHNAKETAGDTSAIYRTELLANRRANATRVACVPIVWEEEAT